MPAITPRIESSGGNRRRDFETGVSLDGTATGAVSMTTVLASFSLPYR